MRFFIETNRADLALNNEFTSKVNTELNRVGYQTKLFQPNNTGHDTGVFVQLRIQSNNQQEDIGRLCFHVNEAFSQKLCGTAYDSRNKMTILYFDDPILEAEGQEMQKLWLPPKRTRKKAAMIMIHPNSFITSRKAKP